MKFEIVQEDLNIKKQALGLQEAELKRNHLKQEELAEKIANQRVSWKLRLRLFGGFVHLLYL